MKKINVTFEMIEEAEKKLTGIINKTPIQFSQTFTNIVGAEIYLKPENLQKTGSYKIRGAYNRLTNLSEKEKKQGVLTASAGNHAQALALAASMTNTKSNIFMPRNAPITKLEATENYGANVFSEGSNFDEATKKAIKWQKENGGLFISPFNDDLIIAGQGTVGLEIMSELPEVDTIIAPVGGGGMISGLALAAKTIKPSIKIIGVQAKGSPALVESFFSGKLTHMKKSETIADGINIKEPANRTFNIIKKYVDKMFTVDDEEISQAMLYLLERAKLVVEPSGAVGLALLLSKKYKPVGKTVIVLSGGNVDIKMLDNIIQRGMAKSGRYLKFITMINDSPGSLYKLLGKLYDLQASIINVHHDRLRTDLKIGETEVEISIESKNKNHCQEIIENLENDGYQIKII